MTSEQREMMRIAAQRVVDLHRSGRAVDKSTLDWAQWIVANIRPLGRPLGTGAPSDESLPQPLRDGALEDF
jgi:hypothetical protein